jgi:hypothetical protein
VQALSPFSLAARHSSVAFEAGSIFESEKAIFSKRFARRNADDSDVNPAAGIFFFHKKLVG